LYHEDCLIAFKNGDIRVCPWCCIHFQIHSFAFNNSEYFPAEFDPNLEYKPQQVFEIRNDNNIPNDDNISVSSKYCLLKFNDEIEYWYNSVLNQLIKQIASDILEMSHWNGLEAIWPR